MATIQRQIESCQAAGIDILCCPEAILGGLADYALDPRSIAIAAGELDTVLAPLSTARVTTIVGFTELADDDRLFNAAAIVRRGAIAGVYRKVHPAIRHSVYSAGSANPVFTIDNLTFGIVICYDSNFPELADGMARRGATVLFVPTNNALAAAKASPDLVADARRVDVEIARAQRLWVVRADVAGKSETMVSYGASAIVDSGGRVIGSARQLTEELLVAEI